MLKLKVCGMRNSENITSLSTIQPDFIGFIFHEQSSRNISQTILIGTPENINRVGVFVNKSKEFIAGKIKQYHLDYIQLHGTESSEFCSEIKKLKVGIIKAFNISENFNFSKLSTYESSCDYLLFDAFGKQAGGNGITFNWELLSKYKGNTPFLLSGGIDETMTVEIKKIRHPQFVGVDINSRFELEPALKNIGKIKCFSKSIKMQKITP